MEEKKIGRTKLVINQLGYVQRGENHDDKDSAYFEI